MQQKIASMRRDGECTCHPMCSLHMWTAEQGTSARKGKAQPGKGCGEDMFNSSLFLQLYRKFQLLAVCLGKPHLVTLSEQREKKERRKVYQNVMFEYLFCFGYRLEISALPLH